MSGVLIVIGAFVVAVAVISYVKHRIYGGWDEGEY